MTVELPELWGGLECSVVRVGDAYRDQLRETGHHDRSGDLALVAGLGIRTLRTTCAWERVAPDSDADAEWAWHDARMAEMRRLGIAPILGLVHHGSGPRRTHLLDPMFPEKLAAYAGEVARRYPWVTMWTPVNEPLTTARFSGLYGYWYPHRESERDFLRILVTECRAVLLAMRAVRQVTPEAELIQTDDLGKTFATPPMQARADEHNERRWLSFDLLAGRVDARHPWHRRFLAAGVSPEELDGFRTGELGRFTVGINHYVTSDRFLDHRQALYPTRFYDVNGPDRHVDTEALCIALPEGSTGWLARLREAWARYPEHLLAVTEAHLGCAAPEQVHWLHACWDAALQMRAEGAAMRAVTVWSLFGAVDWSSLLTKQNGTYEAGAFDVSGGTPRPTLLAEAVRHLAERQTGPRPVGEPGWWARDSRLHAWLLEEARSA